MRNPSRLHFAGYHSLTPTPWRGLFFSVVVVLLLWQGVEAATGRLTHPAYLVMMRAAHDAQSATQVARSQRIRLGLMAPRSFDPNETGLIGSEYTEITTTLGDPAAKRTATNPDLAAALVSHIDVLKLPEGSSVLIIASGSFIGADIAAIIAVENLGLRPVLFSSLGASMHGATDLNLTWLDIETELRSKGIINTQSRVALLGGGGSIGRGMDEGSLLVLSAAAQRNGVPLAEEANLDRLLEHLEAISESETGGLPRLVINVGGSTAALGTCIDAGLISPVTMGGALSCQDGTPGLLVRMNARDVPIINLLNMRRVAAEWGLPFDPIPMPVTGNNRTVYGMPAAAQTQSKTPLATGDAQQAG